jgi:hypothetical protein
VKASSRARASLFVRSQVREAGGSGRVCPDAAIPLAGRDSSNGSGNLQHSLGGIEVCRPESSIEVSQWGISPIGVGHYAQFDQPPSCRSAEGRSPDGSFRERGQSCGCGKILAMMQKSYAGGTLPPLVGGNYGRDWLMRISFSKCCLILVMILGIGSYRYLSQSSFVISGNDAPILYEAPPLKDPVARLQKRIEQGTMQLEYSEPGGYLLSVLKQLSIPVSSQTLVFSKTSFQFQHISPANPRALYFNDAVYVGWVQGGDVMEISAVDPERGAMFYTLDQRPGGKPKFVRRDECLQCHASPRTLGVPGHLVRSVYPDSEGLPLLQAGSFLTDHTSPLRERWGGWYVTGTHGTLRHMGNQWVKDISRSDQLDLEPGANLIRLSDRVNLSRYARQDSDLVALMVLEHQTRLHNLLTRANWETRIALHQQDDMNRILGQPSDQWSDSTRRRIHGHAEELLKYLLFSGEAKLDSPVAGTSGFQEEFPKAGPRDRRGRSLRDLDLKTRLFRYPCSFLIYSEAFDALPTAARDYLYRRLHEVLNGTDQGKDFSGLSVQDRTSIREILLDTKPDLPEYWKRTPASDKSLH